jgi:membrane glycosyltransferase
MIFGLFLYALAALHAPSLIFWSAPLTLGYLLAVPFAVLTSRESFGHFLEKTGLCAIPEDLAAPPVLTMLETIAANQDDSI